MKGPVFLYYRLTEFYQNHRQYIKNFDAAQLLGDVVAAGTLDTSCAPLAFNPAGKVIFPCGLIANSMFNGKMTMCAIVQIFSRIFDLSALV